LNRSRLPSTERGTQCNRNAGTMEDRATSRVSAHREV
jgi:hypothetical protein